MKKLSKTELRKLDRELAHEAELWESGELGSDPKTQRRATPKEEARLDEKAGLRMVSVRLPIGTVEELKKIAQGKGLKYQPYLRQLLIQHVKMASAEKLISNPEAIREAVEVIRSLLTNEYETLQLSDAAPKPTGQVTPISDPLMRGAWGLMTRQH